MRRVLRYVGGAAVVALLPLAVAALRNYPGSATVFLLFSFCFLTVLLLALPRPRSYVYTFFAVLLFLGFWLKFVIHTVWSISYIEPVGAFANDAAQWDRALTAAAIATVGVSIGRVIHLALTSRLSRRIPPVPAPVPAWYLQRRKTIWIGSIILILALNLLNLQVAFYQVGVNPKLILPLHLNVPAGWLINIGFALWCAVLVHWEFQRVPASIASTLVLPVAESLVSSISALSRSIYVMHTVSYFFAVGAQWTKARVALSGRKLAGLMVLWALCFAISLIAVSWLRINIYYLAYEPTLFNIPEQKKGIAKPVLGADMSNQIESAVRQVSGLFVDRWIGLEGVLAVSSYPGLGLELLSDAIREDPKLGRRSLYQRIANAWYLDDQTERFTFLSNAGVVALLLLSGSELAVVIGMAFVTLVMLGTETVARRLTANPFLLSVAGIAMANVVAQMTFPYLTLIFFLQLWAAVVFLGGIQRIGPRYSGDTSA